MQTYDWVPGLAAAKSPIEHLHSSNLIH